jgi:hypothetical protein
MDYRFVFTAGSIGGNNRDVQYSIVEGVERCLHKEDRWTTKLSKGRVGG